MRRCARDCAREHQGQQREYERIVVGATVLVVANHSIVGSNRQPSPETRSVLMDLASMVVGADFNTADFSRKLDAAGVLTAPAARGKLLSALSSGIANKKDGVRQLM
jgi:hypothetical protein